MGKTTVDKAKEREALERAKERGEEAYLTFQAEFERLIAGEEPEGGVTRMQLLEETTRKLVTELNTSSLNYVSGMIGSLDEGEIIDSKGPSSSGAASS
jgi:hypothetical protein